MDIFCKIINGEIPSKRRFEDDGGMVIMDVNPRSNGHCLIIPKKHYQDLYDIEMNVLSHIMKVAKKISTLLVEKLRCEGVTLEENNGVSQEVKHFHLHVIPMYGHKVEKISVEEAFHRIVD